VVVFVEAKVESGEGRTEGGYEQFEFAREIAGLVAELVPAFRDGFVGTATLGLTGTMLTWKVFLNEDGTEMTSVPIHPDAASMDFHMRVLGQVLGEDMGECEISRGLSRAVASAQ
jgi:hypothetical protein